MKLIIKNQTLTVEDQRVVYNDRLLFEQTAQSPVLFVGHGDADVTMYRGNFDIDDHVDTRIPLTIMNQYRIENQIALEFGWQDSHYLTLMFGLDKAGRLTVTPQVTDPHWNRLWLRLPATKNEKLYGAGEQLSHFNLRGYHFPLWTFEPGIGRNKQTQTTFEADVHDHAGGDYYTTNYPEATFISTHKYYWHTDSYVYADFDFRNAAFHELQYWGIPAKWVVETADTYVALLEKLTGLLGRQAALPAWTHHGLIAGLQGGTDRVEALKTTLQQNDVTLAGIWAQDWEGIRMTSFGKRLFWNWQYDAQLYPELPQQVQRWRKEGIRFLGYINPYVAIDSPMFAQTNPDYFAKTRGGQVYAVDFGEFNCAVVDFTNPAAFAWFKSVIRTNLIDAGFAGWMADFGEYLPTDVVLSDHSDPMNRHNQWPMLWAKCNYEAVHEAGKADDIVYFMRAGATGSQRYNPLLWAGDQSVNWSLDDGLASTIPAALSAGMTGNGLSHSDIGGYTSRYGNLRTPELFMRWAEMAAFTPVMRSHEGNRPDENFQMYDSPSVMAHLARQTHLFTALTPYREAVLQQVAQHGTPAQRPLFLHYETDAAAYDCQYEYLFGRDLLIAPVHEADQTTWRVHLPADDWIHLWSGRHFSGGDYEITAPLGQMPVFYRGQSNYTKLFETLKQL